MISSCGNSSQQPASPTLLGNKQWWSQGKSKVAVASIAFHCDNCGQQHCFAKNNDVTKAHSKQQPALQKGAVRLQWQALHCGNSVFCILPPPWQQSWQWGQAVFLQNESVPVCWGPDTVAADGWSFISTCGKLVLKHLATLSDMIHAQYMAT